MAQKFNRLRRVKPEPKKPVTPEQRSKWDLWAPLGVAVAVTLASKFWIATPQAAQFFNITNDQWAANDRSVQLVAISLAILAFAVMAWGYKLAKDGRPKAFQILRDRLLVVIGICAGTAYFNFLHLHFGNFIHVWDTYHYYVGAKYFPELSYDKLYECAAVADSESGRLEEVQRRTITDLRTNVMVRTDDILEHPERCKAGFSAARWAEYKADINWFRSRVNETRWMEIHHDHGFNGTPVWIIAGKFLTNLGPANLEQVTRLNTLDPIYIVLGALMIWWAFGPRAFAIAMIVLGTNFPNRYYWTGGAFLRYDWLFYLIATVCLLKKNRPGLAGAALAYTTLLRLFPGLLLLGPVLAAFEYWRAHKKMDPQFIRFIGGGIVGTAVLMGVAFAYVGGVPAWQQFTFNTVKHSNTPLTNHMGLRTVLSHRPDTTGIQTVTQNTIDNWSIWKSTRLEKWHDAKPLFFLIMLGCLVMISLALRHSGPEQWVGAAMGCGLIAFGAELTCYYYCFLMGLALLAEKRREVGLLMAAMGAVTLFIEFHPIQGMSGWLDEQYVAMSIACLVATAGSWFAFTKWGQDDLEPEGDMVLFDDGATATAGVPANYRKRR